MLLGVALLVGVGCACLWRSSRHDRPVQSGGGTRGLAAELLGRNDDAGEHRFIERSRQECIKRSHERYEPRSWSATEVTGFGLAASLDERKQRGFGFATRDEDLATQEPIPDLNIERIDAMSPSAGRRYIEELEGCTRGARAELDRRRAVLLATLTPDDQRFIDRIAAEGGRASIALRRWRTCMASAGHRYRDRGVMLEDLQAQAASASGAGATTDELRRHEIDVAVADWRCSERHVEPVFEEAVDALAERLLARYGVSSLYGETFEPRRQG
jgi:hypothetical protein